MIVSIRALNVGLVVFCIAAVACLCTSMAVWSGDSALRDTEDLLQESVGSAFDVGSTTVVKLSEVYLNQQADSVVRQFSSFFSVIHDASDQICHQMMTEETDVMTSWDYIYSWRKLFYHMVNVFDEYDGLGIVTTKLQTLQTYESYLTLGNRPDGYMHMFTLLNNGTDYDNMTTLPALNRSIQGDVLPDGTGDAYGYPNDHYEVFPVCDATGTTGVESRGAALDRPCQMQLYDIESKHLALLNYQPIGYSLWSPLTSLGYYAGVISQCVYADKAGNRVGITFAGTDLRKITSFLQELDLGQGSLGRVFAVVRNNWVIQGWQHWYMAGTSHGSYVLFSPFCAPHSLLLGLPSVHGGRCLGYLTNISSFYRSFVHEPDRGGYGEDRISAYPMPAKDTDDPLVAGTVDYLTLEHVVNETYTTTNAEKLAQQMAPGSFMMNTTRSPQGEEFFLKYVTSLPHSIIPTSQGKDIRQRTWSELVRGGIGGQEVPPW